MCMYRYLRKGAEMLTTIHVVHGDLHEDNVVLNPATGMPVIIDFDDGLKTEPADDHSP